MIRHAAKKTLFSIVLILVFTSVAFSAEETVLISDILQNPTRFLNTEVVVTGRVESSFPGEGVEPGHYILVDEKLNRIPVTSFTPPGPGSEITVKGVVEIWEETGEVYIKETKVVTKSPYLIPAIVVGGVVLVLIIILILLLRRPAPAARPATATATAQQATAKATAPRTEKLSETERRALAGRPKTEKVPSKPAQLSVLSGEKKGEEIFLITENVVGSDKGNIRFADRGVSGEHARINFVGDKYILTNVSLTNPTIVNGRAVEGDYELKDKDDILFGTVKVKFSLVK
jgi:hypothetical protein